MKSKIVFLVLVLFNSWIAQEESVYNTFLKEFDSLFYNGDSLSELRMNKIYETIDIARSGGSHQGPLFHDSIQVLETYYKNFIGKSENSRIWRIDTIYRGIDKIPIPCLAINDDDNQYTNLLECAVKKDSSLFFYQGAYLSRGVLPTDIDNLNIISNLNIKDDEVRLVFYLHIVAWFSEYLEIIL